MGAQNQKMQFTCTRDGVEINNFTDAGALFDKFRDFSSWSVKTFGLPPAEYAVYVRQLPGDTEWRLVSGVGTFSFPAYLRLQHGATNFDFRGNYDAL